MHRILEFLPSLLLLLVVPAACHGFFQLQAKRSMRSGLGPKEWSKKNKKKSIAIGMMTIVLQMPALEEIVFRAPIIIAFSTLSSGAWYGIYISAALFGAVHWWSELHDIFPLASAKLRLIRKIYHVVMTTCLGILAGYYGIKYQSLLLAMGVHVGWNVSWMLVFMLLRLCVAAARNLLVAAQSRWSRWRTC